MGFWKKIVFLGAVTTLVLIENSVWGEQGNYLIGLVLGSFQHLKTFLQTYSVQQDNQQKNYVHPLDPLTTSEISRVSQFIQDREPSVNWMFIWITLQEPEKALLLPYFLNDTEPQADLIPRKALIVAVHPKTGRTYEGVVKLGTNSSSLEAWNIQPANVDSTFASDEMDFVGELALKDPSVRERLQVYGHFYGNSSNVVTDVWKYGYMKDQPHYLGKRLAQVFFYGRNFANDNFYAHPMGFVAVVDTLTQKVLEIEDIPLHKGFNKTNRLGDRVPETSANFDPEVSGRWYRDVNPIHIVQENGPGFTMENNVLKWQKFKMRVGRNGREALVLHHVSYNDSGVFRPILYRASLSELFVPYGDPRPPFHRKMALDVGEYGLGFTASEIRAPEGCRGSVYFMDAINNDMFGNPSIVKNAFCIYEEDAGILWRKMDPITRRSVTARSQRLVLTFIATVANYDYQFKWMFYQDASIRGEVILTGIVSQNLLGTQATPEGHGTIVMPNINAQFHQHFFAVRLDTEIDGNKNTVSVLDIYPDEAPAGSVENPYGNAFHVNETKLQTPALARTKTNPETCRTWKVTGEPTNLNPITGGPKGWKLIPDHVVRLMMKKDAVLHKKSAFVDYEVWVVPYQEGQLFAAGFYLNESGLPEWVERNPDANIVNEDVVLWHIFGVTHIVRVEDAPVMPTESIGFWFKPANFFTENPGVDVKPIVREPMSKKRDKDRG